VIEYRLVVEADIPGIMELCRVENYKSYCVDAQTTWRAFTAPGVQTVVAVTGLEIRGVAQVLSDGTLRAYLCFILVDRAHRQQGIGRRLAQEVASLSGVARVDVLAGEAARPFYGSFKNREWPGFSIYPNGVPGEKKTGRE
jgi:ribosomal protein S18 acetylase RimI-like enzyme